MELRLNRFQDAQRSIDRHLAANLKSPRGHFLQGERWRLNGEDQEAVQAYETAIRYDPTFPEPRRELGLLLRKLGQSEGAGVELRRYLELAPHAPDTPIIRRYLNALPPRPQ
jgi:regulator of sirC expression with transglutaminase-like and TPR domain